MQLKLRDHIALLYLAATGILFTILSAAIYLMVYNTVYNHLDEDLDAEYMEVHNGIVVLNDRFVFANPNEWKEREHGQIEVNPTFIQIVDINGASIRKTGNLYEADLTFDPSVRTVQYMNLSLSGKPVRQIQKPVLNPTGKVLGYILIAIPLEESALVLKDLLRALAVALPAVLVLLYFITRSIAGRSISPVNNIISTAEKITKENIGERIKLPQHQDELYLLASTMNKLLDRLQDAVLREKQFTADASHELRTPLSVIKGTLEVLIRRPRTIDHYEEKIIYCIGEVNRMSRLVDQLLMLARYESGKISPIPETVNLSEEAANSLERLRPLINEKKISVNFECNSEIFVRADSSMTEIILDNLITNGIKYSAEGSSISVKTEEDQNLAVLSICDSGIGMSAEEINLAFNRFYRSDTARDMSSGGHGLGLAIVKKLSDLQDLHISIESQPDNGTVIYLKFPRAVENLS